MRLHQNPKLQYRRILSLIVLLNFLSMSILPQGVSFAQVAPQLSSLIITPGVAFSPAVIKGINIYPDNPLKFDFIIDQGDEHLNQDEFKKEAGKLIKYFLASLTVPEEQTWVNLSPYEKDRIIPKAFGQTAMGQEMLIQDYLLKQLTASFMQPDSELGKKFWSRVYSKAKEKFGTTEVPVDTFNKIWIVPQKAFVYEHNKGAFIVESHLKVMLEDDYVAISSNPKTSSAAATQQNPQTTALIREILIPEIEKEVNEGKTFANLRQIFNSMILATWYKQALKESILGKVYADKNKIKGIESETADIKEQVYQKYLDAFQKGTAGLIKEDYDPTTQQIISRKYFTGGFKSDGLAKAVNLNKSSHAMLSPQDRDKALLAVQKIRNGQEVTIEMIAPDAAMTAGNLVKSSIFELRTALNQEGAVSISPSGQITILDENKLKGKTLDILKANEKHPEQNGISREAVTISREIGIKLDLGNFSTAQTLEDHLTDKDAAMVDSSTRELPNLRITVQGSEGTQRKVTFERLSDHQRWSGDSTRPVQETPEAFVLFLSKYIPGRNIDLSLHPNDFLDLPGIVRSLNVISSSDLALETSDRAMLGYQIGAVVTFLKPEVVKNVHQAGQLQAKVENAIVEAVGLNNIINYLAKISGKTPKQVKDVFIGNFMLLPSKEKKGTYSLMVRVLHESSFNEVFKLLNPSTGTLKKTHYDQFQSFIFAKIDGPKLIKEFAEIFGKSEKEVVRAMGKNNLFSSAALEWKQESDLGMLSTTEEQISLLNDLTLEISGLESRKVSPAAKAQRYQSLKEIFISLGSINETPEIKQNVAKEINRVLSDLYKTTEDYFDLKALKGYGWEGLRARLAGEWAIQSLNRKKGRPLGEVLLNDGFWITSFEDLLFPMQALLTVKRERPELLKKIHENLERVSSHFKWADTKEEDVKIVEYLLSRKILRRDGILSSRIERVLRNSYEPRAPYLVRSPIKAPDRAMLKAATDDPQIIEDVLDNASGEKLRGETRETVQKLLKGLVGLTEVVNFTLLKALNSPISTESYRQVEAHLRSNYAAYYISAHYRSHLIWEDLASYGFESGISRDQASHNIAAILSSLEYYQGQDTSVVAQKVIDDFDQLRTSDAAMLKQSSAYVKFLPKGIRLGTIRGYGFFFKQQFNQGLDLLTDNEAEKEKIAQSLGQLVSTFQQFEKTVETDNSLKAYRAFTYYATERNRNRGRVIELLFLGDTKEAVKRNIALAQNIAEQSKAIIDTLDFNLYQFPEVVSEVAQEQPRQVEVKVIVDLFELMEKAQSFIDAGKKFKLDFGGYKLRMQFYGSDLIPVGETLSSSGSYTRLMRYYPSLKVVEDKAPDAGLTKEQNSSKSDRAMKTVAPKDIGKLIQEVLASEGDPKGVEVSLGGIGSTLLSPEKVKAHEGEIISVITSLNQEIQWALEGASYIDISDLPEYHIERRDALIFMAIGQFLGYWDITLDPQKSKTRQIPAVINVKRNKLLYAKSLSKFQNPETSLAGLDAIFGYISSFSFVAKDKNHFYQLAEKFDALDSQKSYTPQQLMQLIQTTYEEINALTAAAASEDAVLQKLAELEIYGTKLYGITQDPTFYDTLNYYYAKKLFEHLAQGKTKLYAHVLNEFVKFAPWVKKGNTQMMVSRLSPTARGIFMYLWNIRQDLLFEYSTSMTNLQMIKFISETLKSDDAVDRLTKRELLILEKLEIKDEITDAQKKLVEKIHLRYLKNNLPKAFSARSHDELLEELRELAKTNPSEIIDDLLRRAERKGFLSEFKGSYSDLRASSEITVARELINQTKKNPDAAMTTSSQKIRIIGDPVVKQKDGGYQIDIHLKDGTTQTMVPKAAQIFNKANTTWDNLHYAVAVPYWSTENPQRVHISVKLPGELPFDLVGAKDNMIKYLPAVSFDDLGRSVIAIFRTLEDQEKGTWHVNYAITSKNIARYVVSDNVKAFIKNTKNQDVKDIVDVKFAQNVSNMFVITYTLKDGMQDKIQVRLGELTFKPGDAAMQAPGGIDFNPKALDLNIKRDGQGLPLPVSQQPMEDFMKLDGFTPVIINITPIQNLPLILGLKDEETQEKELSKAL
jgi:hypothetical protein